MNLSKNVFLGLLALTALSCTNDSESDLIDKTSNNSITYNGTIKSIITQNCIVCHSQPPQNGAPMPLATYDNVKEAVENRELIDRISSFDAAFLMPFGGQRLPQPQIDQIIAWKNANFPE